VIEIHIDLQAVDVIRMIGFPEGSAYEETIYDDMMSTLWSFERPTLTRRYLIAIGLYLSDNFESSSWLVVAFIGQVEVGRMEYLIPGGDLPRQIPTPAQRISRYQRNPVI